METLQMAKQLKSMQHTYVWQMKKKYFLLHFVKATLASIAQYPTQSIGYGEKYFAQVFTFVSKVVSV